MKQITFNISEEQAALLKERAKVTGVLQSEIIRRAIEANLLLPAHRVLNSVPASVLFTPKQETR